MSAARIFLDLPERTASQRQEAEREAISVEMLDSIIKALQEGPELPPPPIEALPLTDSVLGLLPLDRAGAVNWVQAREEDIIRPRRARPGTPADSSAVFPFDIYLNGSDGPQAFFPHSEHQAWLSCQSCHPRVYGGDLDVFTAEEIHGDRSCGSCHNGIAFPIESCERCHADADDLPAGRLEPSLGGWLQLVRVSPPPQEVGDTLSFGSVVTRFGNASNNYPPAVFPHGTHRVRFQCRACHEKPFATELGGTKLSRETAHGTQACGACHNGRVAFDTGMGDCNRCHQSAARTAPEQP